MCDAKRQIVDCQLGPISLRTLRGLQSPAACAALRFNMLIVSAMADVVAHSDLRRRYRSNADLPFWIFWSNLGLIDILSGAMVKVAGGE